MNLTPDFVLSELKRIAQDPHSVNLHLFIMLVAAALVILLERK